MTVHIPEGFGQASIRFSCVGVTDPIICTYGYQSSDGLPIGERADAHAENMFTLATGASPRFLFGGWFTQEYTVQSLSVVENWDGELLQGISTGPAVTGTNATPSLPPNCAILVRKNTARSGRRFRGRWYLPPMHIGEELTAANGQLLGSMVNHQARMNTFVADLSTNNLPMVLLHGFTQVKGQPPRTDFQNLPVPTPVTSLTVQPMIATQRRRLR